MMKIKTMIKTMIARWTSYLNQKKLVASFTHKFLAFAILFIAISLTACAGGGGGGPDPVSRDYRVVGLTAVPASNTLNVGWTNPDEEDIVGFVITLTDLTDLRAPVIKISISTESEQVDFGPRGSVSLTTADFENGNLENEHQYRVSVVILYRGDSGDRGPPAAPVERFVGPNMDGDTVPDFLDDFADDPCATTDTDGDGDPDTLVPGCDTTLTKDLDSDGDGVEDLTDSCPLVPNPGAGQDADGDADGIPDACDLDIDGDGLPDIRDAIPLRDCGRFDLDTDGDGFPDKKADAEREGLDDICAAILQMISEDRDDDGDGLIEIFYLDELVTLSYDRNGDGEDDDGLARTVGDTGCPLSSCTGYELTGDLDFENSDHYKDPTKMDEWTNGSGWVPIGCTGEPVVCEPYYSTLDGGGYEIANLFINIVTVVNITVTPVEEVRMIDTVMEVEMLNATTNMTFFVNQTFVTNINVTVNRTSTVFTEKERIPYLGLFGYVTDYGIPGRGAAIRNLTLADANIKGTGASQALGALSGKGVFASVSNVRAENVTISSTGRRVGGLVGDCGRCKIADSYVTGSKVKGDLWVGGLGGWIVYSRVYNSYAEVEVAGSGAVGGLIGDATSSHVRHSYATGNVKGSNSIGGLVGRMGIGSSVERGKITSSYASGNVTGYNLNTGGLVGYTDGATISGSYVDGGRVRGYAIVGGLIGVARGKVADTIVRASYARNQEVRATTTTRHGWVLNINIGSLYLGGLSISAYHGGLIGLAEDVHIRHSYAAPDQFTSEPDAVRGGLVGAGAWRKGPGRDNDLRYGLVRSDTIGTGSTKRSYNTYLTTDLPPGTDYSEYITDSYWDREITGVNLWNVPPSVHGASRSDPPANSYAGVGEPQSTSTLKEGQVGTGGDVYEFWDNYWCNPNTGEFLTEAPDSSVANFEDYVPAWDTSDTGSYPLLNCPPEGIEQQRP